jgi:hypothetical protein
MKALPFPHSPLSVVYLTIVLLQALGAGILLTLLWEWLPPFWSRTVILLQGVALTVVLFAYRWRPLRRLIFYPLLIAAVTYLWDETLPPPHLTDTEQRLYVPLLLLACVAADLLFTWWRVLPFAPATLRIYGNYVNLDEAAHYLRIPPDVARMLLNQAGRPIHTGKSGEDYIMMHDLRLLVAAIREQERISP